MSKASLHTATKAYITGFIYSILLTVAAFALVEYSSASRTLIIFGVLVMALIQLTVQLYYFLHVGRETKPRWNLMALAFMLLVVIIVVVGSLWIMGHLNYHVHHHSDQYIIQDEGITPSAE